MRIHEQVKKYTDAFDWKKKHRVHVPVQKKRTKKRRVCKICRIYRVLFLLMAIILGAWVLLNLEQYRF